MRESSRETTPETQAPDRVRRAICLLNAALFDEAVAELACVAGDGFDADGDPLGWFASNCTRPDLTTAELRRAIAVDSEDPAMHFQLGVRLVEEDRIEEAELRFTQTLSIERDHVEAQAFLGLCRNALGDPAAAVAHLQRAVALGPQDARFSFLCGKIAGAAHRNGMRIALSPTVPANGPPIGP